MEYFESAPYVSSKSASEDTIVFLFALFFSIHICSVMRAVLRF